MFAAYVLEHCDGTTDDRLTYAWQRALQREPTQAERRAMRELLAEHLKVYQADAAAAEDLLRVGMAPVPQSIAKPELAAWTHVTRVLLNLHETITRN